MRPWLRPLPFALLGAYGLARVSHASVDDTAANRSAALCASLVDEEVHCTADDVIWIDGPSGVAGAMRGKARALVRGRDKEDALDLFSIPARLSPEGRLLDLEPPINLTHSS